MDSWVLGEVLALCHCSMQYPSPCGRALRVESKDTAGCFELRISVSGNEERITSFCRLKEQIPLKRDCV